MALRDYQEACVNAIPNFYASRPRFEDRKGHCLIGLPTGTGKSHVIAGSIQRALAEYPRQRFLMVTHDKRLIQQNANKLLEAWPTAPMGICSAGLNQRDVVQPIIFGGIGTMVNQVALLGHRDVCYVDEAHLINVQKNTMYKKFLEHLWAINPRMKIVGLTASPFRLGQGTLLDAGLFDDYAINLTDVESFNRFISEGYIVPLIPKRTATQLDVSKVGQAQGEFKQDDLQKAVDIYEVTYAALQEAYEAGQDRHSWLCFASGIEHAEHIAEILNQFGVPTVAVHSKLGEEECDRRIEEFKAGKWRCIVNYKMLTTGFDHPAIDFIIDLYPTISPGLHVQKNGRGTRPVYAPGFDLGTIAGRLASIAASTKQNCLVHDYAGNTARLGPINDPVIPKKKGPGTGEAPVRICDKCGVYNHASARFCIGCGAEFTFKVKITTTAAEAELIRKAEEPEVAYFDVLKMEYFEQKREGSAPSLRVVYHTRFQRFNEWVNFESPIPYAKHLAHEWFRQRYPLEPDQKCPELVAQVLTVTNQLREPKRIRVHVNNKPKPKVLSYEF